MHRKLLLICAPVGFGKTTLIGEWIRQIGAGIAWVSLDHDDNDLTRFWAYVITALQATAPDIAQDFGQEALLLLQTPKSPQYDLMMAGLINSLTALAEDIVLILDDYHLIDAQTIHTTLTYLLDHLPPRLHILIASRADPPLPLSRLRARNQLLELRADDVRFNHAETAAFLQRAVALPLSNEDIGALEMRTEGWIAGLQLAAHSVQGRTDVGDFLAAFTGSHRYIVDYLAEEIFHQQTETVQTFLLHTSILEHLSAPLCDALSGRNDGQRMLEQLERANLLLVPLDEERRWYRYHQLLATFLVTRLRRTYPERVAPLHLAAARWYEQQGMVIEAIDHFVAAQAWEQAADTLERVVGFLLTQGGLDMVQRWLSILPADVQRRTFLRIARAWLAALHERFDEVEALLQTVELELPRESAKTGQALGLVAAIRAYLASGRGDMARSIELSEQALDHLPDENVFLRGLLALNLARAYRLRGDAVAASQTMADLHAMTQAGGDLQTMFMRLRLLMLQGRLRQAAATCRQILRQVEVSRPDRRADSTWKAANIAWSALLYERNELDEAEQRLHKVIAEADHNRSGVEDLIGTALLARIGQVRGRALEAQSLLRRIEAMSRNLGIHPIEAQVRAMIARLALAHGDVAAAVEWAQNFDASLTQKPGVVHEFESLMRARIFLHQGQAQAALRLLDGLQLTATASEMPRSAIEISLLQALALEAVGRRQSALEQLARALAVAEPEGYIRIFVDEGEPLWPLLNSLRQAQRRGDFAAITAPYVDELAQTLATEHPPLAANAGYPVEQPLVEPLTEREIDVLRAMARGCSNAEIAEELTVAVSTVRTHIKNLYGKLAVRNRVEAVNRARELNLLASAPS